MCFPLAPQNFLLYNKANPDGYRGGPSDGPACRPDSDKGWSMTSSVNFKQVKKREKAFRRDLIMDAAERLFAARPFDRVQMREIAKEIGLSPGSIYTYFTDQETLFLETALRGAERIKELLDTVDGDADLDVGDLAVRYIDLIMERFEYLRMSQHCLLYGKFKNPDSLEKVFATFRALFDRFDHILKNHLPEENLRLHTHLLFASLNGILFTFGRYPNRTDEETVAYMRKLASALADLFRGAREN
jgi:AcrR family transcriptional regulator